MARPAGASSGRLRTASTRRARLQPADQREQRRPSIRTSAPRRRAGRSSNSTSTWATTAAKRGRSTWSVRAPDWSDSAVCQFVLAPNSPLRTHTLQGITAADWTGIRLEISPVEEDSSSVLHLDNVALERAPGLSISATTCISPDLPDTNAVSNGTFDSDLNGWGFWDGAVSQWDSGVMESVPQHGSGSATAYQAVGDPVALNSHVELRTGFGQQQRCRQAGDRRLFTASDWYELLGLSVPAPGEHRACKPTRSRGGRPRRGRTAWSN